MKNKKFKKIYSLFNLIIILGLFLSPSSAQAISVGNVSKLWGISGPGMLANEILSEYGLDASTVKSFTEVANVSQLKKTPPQVSLFFTPTNPSEGEKVTVTASPSYFMNNPKELYYTWFLKSAICYDRDSDGSGYKNKFESGDFDKCDLNNDDEVDIEDYKIKAMRIIANGGFIISSDNIYKSSSDDDGYEASSGGNDQKGKKAYCYIRDTESGEEYQLKYCGHLFPSAKYENFIDHNGNEIDLDEETATTADFGRDEEKFWQTDPNSNDTANKGNPDEATIAGLGITSFAWNYQKGDKVGVVVEGVSTDAPPTEDASYKTMWAMNKGMDDFDAHLTNEDYPSTTDEIISTTIDTPIAGQTTYLTETTLKEIEGEIVNGIANIKTTVTMHNVVRVTATQALVSDTNVAETDTVLNPIITYSTEDFSEEYELDDGEIEKPSDLNKFLYDSLVSPQENTPGSNKLDIALSYSPNNPINDPSGASGDGDLLTINSSISNAKDTNYLQYDWKVYAATDISSDLWGDPLLKSALFESTQSVGLGIDTFKFKLGLPETNKYLKIVLTVTENTGDENHPRKSTQDVIIPISSTTEKIITHNIIATDSTDINNLSKVNLALGNEICNDDQNPMEKAICPVTKNQIVGISVPAEHFPEETNPDFLWTVDGKPFSYPYCFFSNCDLTKQTNVAYFPVLKEVGEQYVVNLTATNKKGEKINITRNFQVVDPKITILSADTTTCNQTVLGKYFDVDGKSFYDYSLLNFWAYNNSNIKLKAVTTGFSASPESLGWEIDGDSINSANASVYGFRIDSTGTLTLPPKEKQGESYNISVGTLYTQNNLVKKALNAIWGVTYNQFYEKAVSDDAIITMQDAPVTTTSAKSKKIFATIYSSTPAYLAFLLRIVLTISLILFVTKLVFSFAPQINSREE
ncbi:MAG: hypothetical protein US30_C0005G0035 [Candidatus Moranbacteria bacterium GW2011_GWF2_36_839]|nr:MAG: hypothetical protein US27_C0005G0019 [Candidatus Moranbacteria bacterium GW2011_GWF1_36_78]KKQ17222.1 MAG: hypothetical protein US30_C0005G0035 [Candidatus Moranbacteria bacterium GW2011_GWF2_36_839]HAT73740.1 hypothetical protein [Candidatus Moranbacteria bacterium]HBY11271.1 hypothetical protein [Candidatus Moranbacteria bacterium]